MRYRILDLETCTHPGVVDWLDPCEPDPDLLKPIEPDARLKDPEKKAANLAEVERKRAERPALIAQSILDRTAERNEKCALDPDCCRIVALGYYDVGYAEPTVYLMRDEFEEREQLKLFWASYDKHYTRFVTFNGARFDLPVLVMRSIYLDVPHPEVTFYPAWKSEHIDLYEKLSINGARRDVHGLRFYAKRLGIGTLDKVDGSQIAQLVREERWQEIHDHCLSDIGLTHALANRLGLLKLAGVAA
jgi:hypothetical protein